MEVLKPTEFNDKITNPVFSDWQVATEEKSPGSNFVMLGNQTKLFFCKIFK